MFINSKFCFTEPLEFKGLKYMNDVLTQKMVYKLGTKFIANSFYVIETGVGVYSKFTSNPDFKRAAKVKTAKV